MVEHPVNQAIEHIVIDETETCFTVGRNGVTSIEACTKSGMHANIPYVRVWKGDVCLAEFCQHQIVGVYFSAYPTNPPALSE